MTIKGTLETFNLRELLQMLAFNQKVGTLVLDTENGAHTIHVDQGRASFLDRDSRISETFLGILRRDGEHDPERLDRAWSIHEHSGRFVGDVVVELGVIDNAGRAAIYDQAVSERLFDIQLTSILRFEFLDGEVLTPEGEVGTPIQPALPVEGLLLELTRKVDQWGAVAEIIPTVNEVFEGTEVAVDLSEDPDLDLEIAQRVVPAIDGYRTLQQISDASSVDLFSVVHIAAALCQAGGIRPVPTEDLLVRAEQLLGAGRPQDALPLLRRTVDRGDASPITRMRIADALEAQGDVESAATELESFAALSSDADAPTVFQALQRALALRKGDIAAACRLCDYYIRHRPWLREHHADAVGALRALIDEAAAVGRSTDAAERLAAFIEAGDVPSEDLLLLSDLFAADGRNAEAAGALLRRAEDLMVAGRTAPARSLYRRCLDLDPSRADARRRLLDIDGATRKRRQRRRVIVVVVLFLLAAVAAGAAWWTYNREAGRSVRQARDLAEAAVKRAESRAEVLLSTYGEQVEAARSAEEDAADLGAAGVALVRDARDLLESLQPDLAHYATELENHASSGHGDSHRLILKGLEHRQRTLVTKAEQAVEATRQAGVAALRRAEKANTAGRFRDARKDLLMARNLSAAEDGTHTRAALLLTHVTAYTQRFEARAAAMDRARQERGEAGAWREGVAILQELLDSDLTRELRFPVRVESEPAGARIYLGGTRTGHVTPAVIEYSPFQPNPVVELRQAGRKSATRRLPSWNDIEGNSPEVRSFQPRIRLTLPQGPRFRVSAPRGRFQALWIEKELPVVLRDDGRTMQGVDPDTGDLGPGAQTGAGSPIQSAGTLEGGHAWRIRGRRTLQVLPRGGEAWEAQCPGLLERRPCIQGDVICVVDARGNALGFRLADGEPLWRRSLGAAPSQPAYASSLGILVGTITGATFRIAPEAGDLEPLVTPTKGTAFALPFGDAAIVLGHGPKGIRRITQDGESRLVGAAAPKAGARPLVTREGLAWLDADGAVRWLTPRLVDRGPVTVAGLGRGITALGSDGRDLFGLTTSGALRGVALEDPRTPILDLPLEGTPGSRPHPAGRSVYVLVDGDLMAIER